MTNIIKSNNPPTPTTLNVSSSTDNVLIEDASSTLADGPEEEVADGLDEGLDDGVPDIATSLAAPELPAKPPFILIELEPLESPESPEPEPDFEEPDSLL